MREMTLDEVHSVLYDILVDVHDFCVKNNIKYSLAGGTLLGAIRHNGFIPWDDDIDVQMTRPEYERFIHSYKSNKYSIFSRELDKEDDIRIGFTRICEMDRTYVDTRLSPWKKGKTGLWIDVVPIDGAPSNKKDAYKKIRRMYLYWRIINISRVKLCMRGGDNVSLYIMLKMAAKFLVSFFIPNRLIDKYIVMCQEYDFEKSAYLANYSTMQNSYKEWQPKDSMSNYILHRFEKGNFYIMEGFKTSLRSLYGDYMKLPPVEKQTAHIENLYYWK